MSRDSAREFTVPANLAGQRLDRAIAALASGVSRGEARRLIAAGVVFVDGKRTGIQSRVVRAGERVRWEQPAQPPAGEDRHEPGAQPRIVVERPELWIVDKPAGMPVEPTRAGSRGTLQEWLAHHHGPAYVTHRLDTPTSGLIVVARDRRAQAGLNQLFGAHAIGRRYLAVVTPAPPWERLTMNGPLDGRAAVTHAAVAARAAAAAALVVRLETGRTRQIRRHLAGAGFPVVGETAAGERTQVRLLLHAFELALPAAELGPTTMEAIVATSAPPADFQRPAEELGLAPADLGVQLSGGARQSSS
ncbi:MAG TPA: RluA family pseudouridine synthase [Polyangia bacterium]|jgi:23S rRNA pseudouridine1911/1915/1917 synthase|nr:RluA family pseudouridine synthase [Polyangia bacterium]